MAAFPDPHLEACLAGQMKCVPTERVAQVLDLQKRVDDVRQSEPDGICSEPLTLLRYIMSREGDVDAAEKMLRDSAKWRVDNDIPGALAEWGMPVGILAENGGGAAAAAAYVAAAEASGTGGGGTVDSPLGPLASTGTAPVRLSTTTAAPVSPFGLQPSVRPCARVPSTPRSELAETHFYGGRLPTLARDGCPVLVERLGNADLSGIAREKLVDHVISAYSVYLEDAFQCVRAESLRQQRLVRAHVIVDCAGLGMNFATHIGIIKRVAGVGPPNFPEVTQKVSVVRAPRLFAMVWGLISPLLPLRTRNKVTVVGHANYLSTLSAIIEPDHLPVFLGGKYEGATIGPCNPVPRGAADGPGGGAWDAKAAAARATAAADSAPPPRRTSWFGR